MSDGFLVSFITSYNFYLNFTILAFWFKRVLKTKQKMIEIHIEHSKSRCARTVVWRSTTRKLRQKKIQSLFVPTLSHINRKPDGFIFFAANLRDNPVHTFNRSTVGKDIPNHHYSLLAILRSR